MRALLAICTLLLSVSLSAFAGGPLLTTGPTQGVAGQPVKWDNTKAISYRVANDALGSMTHANAVNLVAQKLQIWASVPTASLSFQNAGAIQGVPNGSVLSVSAYNTVMGSCYAGQQSPIMFDNGSLVQQLTGDSSVLGFSGSCSFTADGKIQTAFSMLANQSGLPSWVLDVEVLHELGHFLGLDHTDVRSPLPTGTTIDDVNSLPTMFFQVMNQSQSSLAADDTAWISRLYPSSRYNSSYGTISGRILFSDGVYGAQDVLVIARKVGDEHVTAVASISGYRFTSNPGQKISTDYMPCVPATDCTNGTWGDNPGTEFGATDPAMAGHYDIPVPPGQYTVEVQALSQDGKIGPMDPPFPLPGPAEYWDTNESDHDWAAWPADYAPPNPGVVSVAAGQAVDNIDIILNGTDPAFDLFEQPASTGSARPAGGAQ